MRMEEVQGRSAAPEPQEHTVLEVEGRYITIDQEGYLIDPADWSMAVTETMAQADGLELVDDHWLLIDFLNRFYAECPCWRGICARTSMTVVGRVAT